ncbi:MAG TPA: PAS domain S-box protein, partial [Pyrinomonadaceae bacterium]|nr:PAS domain S-box protein [Pyrinomonadaceae bacterium]
MEDELSRVLNALPALVWTALLGGQIDFLNLCWRQYTGLSLEEACGRGWQAAIHPEDLPVLLGRWRSILASGESGEMEARLQRFDGDYHWFHISASPLRNAAGSVVKWLGVGTDIDDRKKAEEALRSNERNLSLIINTIPTHIYVLNTEGSVQYVNQAVMDYTGLSLEDVKQ